jgi:cytochrome c556
VVNLSSVMNARQQMLQGRVRKLVVCGALAVAMVAASFAAVGQEQASQAQMPPPKDTIFARKILMGAIGMNMDEIETMLAPGGKFETAEAVEHTDTISIMLQSFPHLFPPSTNQWKPNDPDRDPATDTSASPELWRNFGDFYQRAQAASKFALDATRAKHGNEFKALIGQLRAACNGCHAAYLKTE